MTQVSTFNPILALPKVQPRKPKQPETVKPMFSSETAARPALPSVPPALQQIYFGGVQDALKIASAAVSQEQLSKETEVLNWTEYLTKVYDRPQVARDAYQRIFDMITSQPVHVARNENGSPMRTESGDLIYTYEFFTNPSNGKYAIAGLEEPIHALVQNLKAAAQGGDTKNRFFMLKGPVGTAKSTMVNLLKAGLETYSKTDEGALYALGWKDLPAEVATDHELQLNTRDKIGPDGQPVLDKDGNPVQEYFYIEPMADDPLKVLPKETRKKILADLNQEFAESSPGGIPPYQIEMEGQLSPASFLIREKLTNYYTQGVEAGTIKLKPGETIMTKVLDHVEARRYTLSEKGRRGIGSYVPKDAKNQDSTELNGDIDYSRLPMYGDPNHPLVQAYRGEFNVANRGLMDFEEILKLQREFLYDLLHASQERIIKPKNGTQISVDMFIIGKTNMEELDDKLKDDKMKAFFNRAVEIEVPYLLDPAKEAQIYGDKGFVGLARARGLKVGPHAVEIAAEWAVQTRKDATITKNKIMDNGTGFYGASPRFLQNVFDLALVHSNTVESGSVTPITVLRVLEEKLNQGGVKDSDDKIPAYKNILIGIKRKLTRQFEKDVVAAVTHEDSSLFRAYLQRYTSELGKWKADPATANENFLRQVETSVPTLRGVQQPEVVSFRNQMLAALEAFSGSEDQLIESEESLKTALGKVIYDDLLTSSLDESQVVQALQENMGYDPATAREAVQHLTTPGGIL